MRIVGIILVCLFFLGALLILYCILTAGGYDCTIAGKKKLKKDIPLHEEYSFWSPKKGCLSKGEIVMLTGEFVHQLNMKTLVRVKYTKYGSGWIDKDAIAIETA